MTTITRTTCPRLSALFAGDRRVWLAAALLGVPLIVFLLVWCLIPRGYYTGTDSVNAATITPPIHRGTTACVTGLDLPAGTRRLQLGIATGQTRAPHLRATVSLPGATMGSSAVGPSVVGQLGRVSLPVPPLPPGAASVPARVCLRSTSAGTFGIWGTETLLGLAGQLRVHHKLSLYRAAVWYLPRAGVRTSYLGEFGTMADRAALFAPGFARPWLFFAVFFGVLPLIGLAAVRLVALAVAGQAKSRRAIVWLYVIAALNAASWSVITPAFQGPDEVDHFAYTESLVERGIRPTPYATTEPRWSSAEADAMLGADFYTDHVIADSRVPGTRAQVRAYRALPARDKTLRNNGGGTQTTASYGPLYYYAVAPGYLLGGSEFSRLGAMRLCSALIGALSAVFAFLLMRELVPRRRWLWVLAGLLVAFFPMYSFLSGAVNNDVGIDVGGAAVAYLLVRLVRRGLPPALVAALGALLGALPWVKSSAYELWVLALLTAPLAVWSHRRSLRARVGGRIALAAWPVATVAFIAAYLLGKRLDAAIAPTAPVNAGLAAVTSTTGAATGTLDGILHNPSAYLTYLWEIFLPRLPGMPAHFPVGNPAATIFLRRGWAAFGWYDVLFPKWVYVCIAIAMVLALVLGVRGLWLRRRTAGGWWPAVVLLVLFPVMVFAGFEAAFFTLSSRPVVAEMGRYEFPALVPLAVLGVGSLFGLGDRVRLRIGVGAFALVLFLALSYASQVLSFTAFYS